MKKKRSTIAAGILLLVCLIILWTGSRSSQAGIRQFVLSHQAELEEIAADCLNRGRTAERYKGVEVEGIYPGTSPIVQFYTGGFGLVPSAAYWGFYYSESGQPAAYQNVDMELVPISENEWTWSDGTDNGGVTQRIDTHWFSYKAWF